MGYLNDWHPCLIQRLCDGMDLLDGKLVAHRV
jgi:hypothetical protein